MILESQDELRLVGIVLNRLVNTTPQTPAEKAWRGLLTKAADAYKQMSASNVPHTEEQQQQQQQQVEHLTPIGGPPPRRMVHYHHGDSVPHLFTGDWDKVTCLDCLGRRPI